MTAKPAAFLDRDGTIIRDTIHVRDAERIELLPGVADAIRRLNEHNVPVIVVTNQSGIARGIFSLQDYEHVRARIDDLLAEGGARVDDTYMCPHHPEITGPCECRKPGTLLYRQATRNRGLDPSRSLFVGDHWRDVAPAGAFNGLAIMLDVETTLPADRELAAGAAVPTAASLGQAVDRFLATLPALTFRP